MSRIVSLAVVSTGLLLSSQANHAARALNIEDRPANRPPITALTALPDSPGALVGSQAGVVSAGTPSELQLAIRTDLDHVHDLTFSPDGSLLAIAGGSPGEFGIVEIWSTRQNKCLRQLEGHDDVVYAVQWLEGGNMLVTASADRTVRIWNTDDGTLHSTLVGHSAPVLCLAVSPDQQLLCSGSVDQTIRVWNVATGQLVRSLTNHLGPVHALAFRIPASGQTAPSYLASAGGDGTVRIWQPEIGRLVRIVRHPVGVLALGWDASGQLYSGSKNGQVSRIDADTGERVQVEQVSGGWITNIAIDRKNNEVWIGDSAGKVQSLLSRK